MYGPPQAPQPSPPGPASGGLIALRVLFVALPLLSCGFLAWAPMLRLAILTRAVRDWVFFGLAFVVATALFVYMGVTGEKEATDLEAVIGVGTILALGAGSVAYYLVGEIRYYDRRRAMAVPAPYGPLGYGYGPDRSAATTTPSSPPAPAPYFGAVPQPVQPPTAPRIEQVRAELDELSDLLRQDGRDGRDGPHGGQGGEGEGRR
ncbi:MULTISPECIES: hypothetical protein [Streptomyces]|uniref:Integral membrane protein n=1 Tax=Streptomyces venezuelae TaxID=54571 RepID=A0A5P2AU38_STRVZ|nr:hypothetical protein [Streptomyces venezuelae]QES21792.1 hypothetical protein DEJ46_24020 [Streptomyces venezuelae]